MSTIETSIHRVSFITIIRILSIPVTEQSAQSLRNFYYTQAVLKFLKLNTQAQQREAVAQWRSPSPIPVTVYKRLEKILF
ncbi:MAG: hypothetical protein LBJ00_00125 [Planctomycetaceae bacterium]|nr:hypothetical protein [Planctomycetaceae bacterium]